MWSLISSEDFIFLINHWNDINLKNIEIYPIENSDIFEIKIDDKIRVRFIHHHQSLKYHELTKIGIDVYFDHMSDYLIQSYYRRLSRMKENPLFIISNMYDNNLRLSFNQSELSKINKNIQVILCGKDNPELDNVIFVKTLKNDTISIASDIIKKLKINE